MKRNLKIIIIVLISMMAIIFMMAIVDYQMIKNSKEPIFCYYKTVLRDGGSRVYEGFGYTIVNYYNPILQEHKIRIGIFHRPKDPFSYESRQIGYKRE